MLQKSFEKLHPRLRAKIRHVSLPNIYVGSLFFFLAEKMEIDQLTFRFLPQKVVDFNRSWVISERKMLRSRWKSAIGGCKNVRLEVAGQSDVEILPGLRTWMECELREEWLKIEERRQSLRSSRRAIAQA